MHQSKYLTPTEVADRLGVHTNTILNWRKAGIGPTYVQLSPRKIRYNAAELESWIEASTVSAKQVA